jgi:signal transduction histidine kinase
MAVHLLLVAAGLLLMQTRLLVRVGRDRLHAAELVLENSLRAGATREDLAQKAHRLQEAGFLGGRWELVDAAGERLAGPGAPTPPAAAVFTLYIEDERQRLGCVVRSSLPAELGPVGIGGGADALLAAMVAGTVLVTVAMFFFLSRHVIDPVVDLLGATRRLSAGERAGPVSRRASADEVGELVRAFEKMAREVTETRADLERRVAEAVEEAEAAQRQLAFQERLAATGRLAAGIAHEINNPVGGAINAASRLEEGSLSRQKQAEYAGLVREALERIKDVVGRVLAFSRREPSVEAVDPLVPLSKALDFCRHRAEKEGVRLEQHLPARLPAVRADAGELQQVFLNLMQNALDAMQDGGRLLLVAGTGDDATWITITDTGCGMNEEEIGASFDRFHTTKPVGRGTGLGLSISHDIVTRYGGELRLRSAPGRGTTARVVLPRAED